MMARSVKLQSKVGYIDARPFVTNSSKIFLLRTAGPYMRISTFGFGTIGASGGALVGTAYNLRTAADIVDTYGIPRFGWDDHCFASANKIEKLKR